jgi:hypothetical protein
VNYHRLGLTIATIAILGSIIFSAVVFVDKKSRLDQNALLNGANSISVDKVIGKYTGPAPEEICDVKGGGDLYLICVRYKFASELRYYYFAEYAKFFGIFSLFVAFCGGFGYLAGRFIPGILFAGATKGRDGVGAWARWVRSPDPTPTKQDP